MNKRKYIATKILLLINMFFWLRLLVLYISRFAIMEETIYVIIVALLFLDMAAYGVITFGIRYDKKLFKMLLIPFLIVNAVLSVTDEMGFWDVAALVLNLAAILAFILEIRKEKLKRLRASEKKTD